MASGGVGRLIAIDANAFRNFKALQSSGLLQAGDQLIVSPNVAAELARRGVSAADLAAAGVRVASESVVGAATAATRIAEVLRGFGGKGVASAEADALNIAEAVGLRVDAFITKDGAILNAFGGTSVIPGTFGESLLTLGF